MNLKEIVRPRALTYRGVVTASGWWIDPTLCGEVEARRRILSNLSSGDRVFETGGGYLLRFASPRRMRIEAAPAVVIVEEDGWLLGAPLSKSEWATLGQSAARFAAHKLILVKGGELFHATEALAVDVSLWLDVEGWVTLELEPLGEVAPVALAIPAVEYQPRRALDMPASPELLKFLAELRGEIVEDDKRTSWWQRLFGKRGNFEESELLEKAGFARKKSRFSLVNLFRFGFGAAGDAPPLRAGESFSSEFGIVARYLVIGVGLVLAFALISTLASGAEASLGVVLRWLTILGVGALVTWGLMVLARLFPPPQGFVPTVRNSDSDTSPFDLLGFLVLCCCVIVYLALQGDWAWFWVALVIAFCIALRAHWELRRSGGESYMSQGKGAQGGMTAGLSGLAALSALGGFAGLAGLAGLFGKLFGGNKPAQKGNAGAVSPVNVPKLGMSRLQALLWRSQLARLFGARQARYMMRMMEMFERGDLDAALKHAVPFNLFDEGASHPSLGVPRPRADLDFLGPRAVGGAGIALPDEIRTQLTKYYRSAFETLSAQKRVDEAAFVLVELLDSPEEAIQYLEKNESWRKAAELSETRSMDAALTVRLWWLAGERNRAVVVARRSGAFGDAIARLEKMGGKRLESALTLRLIWAHTLALSGDFPSAVEAAWPTIDKVPDTIGIVSAWIERGLEGTGSAAARMLGRQSHLLDHLSPSAIIVWQERVKALLADSDEESVALRLQFAVLVGSSPHHDLSKAAARHTVRALTRDAARFPVWTKELQEKCNNLVAFAGDGPLRIDSSGLSFPQSTGAFSLRSTQIMLTIEATDVGSMAICDAAYLPDGRVLLALGELGARLLSRRAESSISFEQPCHRLVISENGERAIGVALRGLEIAARFKDDKDAFSAFIDSMGVYEYNRRAGLARLCRFDLARKSVEPWGEIAELSAFAPTHEGTQWLIANGDSISSIDTTANGPLALWRTAETGYRHQMNIDDHSLSVTSIFHDRSGSTHREVWRFDLKSLMLRERRLVQFDKNDEHQYFVVPGGYLLMSVTGTGSVISVAKDYNDKVGTMEMPDGEKALQVEVCAEWFAVLSDSSEGQIVRLMKWHDPKALRIQITLSGNGRARIRLTEKILSICDTQGRLIVLDLYNGTIMRNIRLF